MKTNVETYWEVTKVAVVPREMTHEEVNRMKSQTSWLLFHVYKDSFGTDCIIFENRSRAELCFHERCLKTLASLRKELEVQ